MTPTVVEKEKRYFAGYSFYGDPFASSGAWTEENEIGSLWKRFMEFFEMRADEIPPSAITNIGYEMHIWNQSVMETGQYEIFVGMEVKDLERIPVDLSVKILPEMKFAVFTLSGVTIANDLSAQMTGWLDAAGLKQTGNFVYNLYDERYKGTDNLEESEIEVYVPVD